jgi:hypothetical protein
MPKSKRCPNGTRKNKKTGNCEPKGDKKTTTRKVKSSVDNNLIWEYYGGSAAFELSTGPKKKTFTENIPKYHKKTEEKAKKYGMHYTNITRNHNKEMIVDKIIESCDCDKTKREQLEDDEYHIDILVLKRKDTNIIVGAIFFYIDIEKDEDVNGKDIVTVEIEVMPPILNSHDELDKTTIQQLLKDKLKVVIDNVFIFNKKKENMKVKY